MRHIDKKAANSTIKPLSLWNKRMQRRTTDVAVVRFGSTLEEGKDDNGLWGRVQ
jgi:hypothetical protein